MIRTAVGLVLLCAAQLHAAAGDGALADALNDFVTALQQYRSGDDTALAQLRSSARTLCQDYERCDARDIADYYTVQSAADRELGLQQERHFYELWQAVVAAGDGDGEAWPAQRESIVTELEALIDTTRDGPDVSVAAQALGLRARLWVHEMEQNPALITAERAELEESARLAAIEALGHFERTGHLTPRLQLHWLLGRLDRFRGNQSAARIAFETVLRDSRRVQRPEYSRYALLGLAALARDRGDTAAEERALLQLAELSTPADDWDLARLWGRRLLLSDHPGHAVDFLAQYPPATMDDETAMTPERRQWELLMGSARLRDADLAGARGHFEAVTSYVDDDLAHLGMALLELHEGDPLAVLERLEAVVTRPSTTAQVRALAHTLRGEALLEQDEPELAIVELERALALAEEHRARLMRGRLLDAGESATLNVIGEWEGAGLHTVALLADAHRVRSDALSAALVIERFQSRGLRDLAMEELRELAGSESTPLLAHEDLESWADHFELGLVTWVVGADFTVAVAIDSEGARSVRLEMGRREAEEGVRRLREAALAGNRRWLDLANEWRERLLPAELTGRAPSQSGRRLMLLHGPLEALPIELLAPYGDVVPVVLPGLPAFAPGQPRGTWDEWELLGDPLARGGAHALPGAARELSDLAEIYPRARSSTGARFERERVRQALASSSNVHVATHLVGGCESAGRRFPSVGLLLSSGEVLCAEQIYDWSPHLELVVLSACESGGGAFVDAQGLHGLARAFLESGTRNVVATLWPVEDRAAQRFAELFHDALARGAMPSLAAARARSELRSEGAAVSDWAAFRLVGRD